jgi:hypothetical protein
VFGNEIFTNSGLVAVAATVSTSVPRASAGSIFEVGAGVIMGGW